MSDFTIYRNGNCTNTTTAEAEDQIYISVDFDYLRDSKSDYCQETIITMSELELKLTRKNLKHFGDYQKF